MPQYAVQRRSDITSLQHGTYSDRGDKLDWAYYDTLILKNALGAYKARLFTQAIGQTDPTGVVKTLDITNMKTSGILPQNQRFIIRAIKTEYYAHAALTTAQKIYDVLGKTVLEMVINGKDASYQKVLQEVIGMPVACETTTTEAPMEMSYGRYTSIDVLNKPITLAANTPFEWDATLIAASDASLDTDRIRVSMCGILVRAM